MIVGETRAFRLDVNSDTAFVLSVPTLLLRFDDLSTAAPAVTDTAGGGSATDHKLEGYSLASVPGGIVALWGYTVGSQNRIARDTYAATYTDVAGFIRERLQTTTALAPDSLLDGHIVRTLRDITDRFSQLLPTSTPLVYRSMTGTDQERFDEAIALMTAVKLRPVLPKVAPLGEIQGIKVGSQEYRFDTVARARVKDVESLENSWLTEAEESLSSISVIRAYFLSQEADFNPLLTITGPTRQAQKSGLASSPMIDVLRLLSYDWKQTQSAWWRYPNVI